MSETTEAPAAARVDWQSVAYQVAERLEKSERQRRRLHAALEEHGRHLPGCGWPLRGDDEDGRCDCGLVDALRFREPPASAAAHQWVEVGYLLERVGVRPQIVYDSLHYGVGEASAAALRSFVEHGDGVVRRLFAGTPVGPDALRSTPPGPEVDPCWSEAMLAAATDVTAPPPPPAGRCCGTCGEDWSAHACPRIHDGSRPRDEDWPATPELDERGVTLEEKRDGDTRIRDHELVNIFSGEHHCWWRANASGYAADRRDAGVYTMADAYSRTSHCGPEKEIMYYRAPSVATPPPPPACAGCADWEDRYGKLESDFDSLRLAPSDASTETAVSEAVDRLADGGWITAPTYDERRRTAGGFMAVLRAEAPGDGWGADGTCPTCGTERMNGLVVERGTETSPPLESFIGILPPCYGTLVSGTDSGWGTDMGMELDMANARIADLQAALSDVLSYFSFPTHPGRPCHQTGSVPDETLAGWRAVAYPTAAARAGGPRVPGDRTPHVFDIEGLTCLNCGATRWCPAAPAVREALAS